MSYQSMRSVHVRFPLNTISPCLIQSGTFPGPGTIPGAESPSPIARTGRSRPRRILSPQTSATNAAGARKVPKGRAYCASLFRTTIRKTADQRAGKRGQDEGQRRSPPAEVGADHTASSLRPPSRALPFSSRAGRRRKPRAGTPRPTTAPTSDWRRVMSGRKTA